jgi:hypothetical protein
MGKGIEELDGGYVLMYRRGRKEAGEWRCLEENKTNARDRLEGGDDNDEDDDGNVILLNSNFCSGTNRKDLCYLPWNNFGLLQMF